MDMLKTLSRQVLDKICAAILVAVAGFFFFLLLRPIMWESSTTFAGFWGSVLVGTLAFVHGMVEVYQVHRRAGGGKVNK